MSNITNYLNKVKTAIYGKEVRGAIHDAIKQVYDDASVEHDNANMEVKLARGTHNTLNDRLDNVDEIQAQTNAQLLHIEKQKSDTAYVDAQDAYLLRQIEQGATDQQLKDAVQSKVDDGTISSIAVGENGVRPHNLNNGAKNIEPLIWSITNTSVVKDMESITISTYVGVMYRNKYIYITPNKYIFDGSDKFLILRGVDLQEIPENTATPIIVSRPELNENDFILAYRSNQINTIWDNLIADYFKATPSNPLPTSRRTTLGGYGYISSRYPFNINTVDKCIEFNEATYICYNSVFKKITNTVVDITEALKGGHLFYDISTESFTTTQPTHEDYIRLGTIWISPLVVGLNTTNGFTVNGMPYNHIFGRWNGQVLNAIGDSITYGVGCTIQYHQWLKQLCGFKSVNNYGVSGSTIARRPDNSISWDTATALVDRINTIDKTAKVTTVFMGVNDFITSRPLGTFDSEEVTTFYGALHYVCKYFRENMPDKVITFITPMQFNWKLRPAQNSIGEGKNKNGDTLLDYVNVIKEVCGYYGYPVLDMYHNAFYGLSDTTVSTYMPDYLHVNDLGHKEIMSPRIAGHLNSL